MKWILTLILVLSLAKLFNLLALPLYLDEGLYIFWAKLFSDSPGFAYISMQDGKTPLFIWLISYFNKFFNDYLLTARLISVISGLITFICWLFIISKLTKNRLVFIFAFLILVTPFLYLTERMAFTDSLLASLGSLSLAFLYVGFLRFMKNPREIFFWAFLSGIFLGFAYVAKSSAKVFVFSEILIGIFWVLLLIKEKSWTKALYLVGGILLSYVTYSQIVGFLRMGAYRFWNQILEKETQLIFSPVEVLNRLLHVYDPNIYSVYLANLGLILQYFMTYLGVIFLLFLVGIIWIVKKDQKQIWLVAYFLSIFLAILLSGKVMASRYIYMLVPSMVCIASFGLFWIYHSNKVIIKNLVYLGLFFLALQSVLLVIDPLRAVYTEDDKSYLVTADLSALGLREVIDVVKGDGGGTVGVSGVWGVLEGSQIELDSFGISSVNIDHWLSKSDPDLSGNCGTDQAKIDLKCVKIDLKSLEFAEGNRYLFLTRSDEDVIILARVRKVRILRAFQRPNSVSKTYLIKLL